MTQENEWLLLFPEDEIPRILRIVERCAGSLRKVSPSELENDLSDRLRDLIDQDAEFRNDVDAELQREVPIYDRKKAKKKPLGRGDIKFLHGTGKRKPYPYFLIEAKRLHVTFPSGWASLISEYVTGSQGMMCFIEERYSRDLSSGAMLGYVFDNRIRDARNAVHETITRESSRILSIEPHGLSRPGFTQTRAEQSCHDIRGRTFCMYHLFVAV